jgi:hypothetical protein
MNITATIPIRAAKILPLRPRVPYPILAAVQVIFDLAADCDPRAKRVDPKGFIDTRFVREIEQSGAIDQLQSQTR